MWQKADPKVDPRAVLGAADRTEFSGHHSFQHTTSAWGERRALAGLLVDPIRNKREANALFLVHTAY